MMIVNNEPPTHGFPKGYFVIRSLATNRLLDVASDAVEDGAEIILYPQKEASLVEREFTHPPREYISASHSASPSELRIPEANNQVC
jgi:hypothetical protein